MFNGPWAKSSDAVSVARKGKFLQNINVPVGMTPQQASRALTKAVKTIEKKEMKKTGEVATRKVKDNMNDYVAKFKYSIVLGKGKWTIDFVTKTSAGLYTRESKSVAYKDTSKGSRIVNKKVPSWNLVDIKQTSTKHGPRSKNPGSVTTRFDGLGTIRKTEITELAVAEFKQRYGPQAQIFEISNGVRSMNPNYKSIVSGKMSDGIQAGMSGRTLGLIQMNNDMVVVGSAVYVKDVNSVIQRKFSALDNSMRQYIENYVNSKPRSGTTPGMTAIMNHQSRPATNQVQLPVSGQPFFNADSQSSDTSTIDNMEAGFMMRPIKTPKRVNY